jgi:ketosteroid isomerase-like protein
VGPVGVDVGAGLERLQVPTYPDATFHKGVEMDNVQAIRGLYDAFARGDIPAVFAGFDPKIEWREAEGNPYSMKGEAWVGSDEILENLFMKLGTEWDGFSVHPNEFHDAGDTVVVEGRYTGTFKGTGKSMDAQMCHVFKMRDGKVASFQQFVDTAQWQSVVGLK